jgi:trk system potassium uptake protein
MKTGFPVSQIGIDGAIITLAPLLLLLAFTGTEVTGLTTLGALAEIEQWRFIVGAIGAFFGIIFGWRLFKTGPGAKFAGAFAAVASTATAFPYLMENPVAALGGAIFLITFGFVLLDFKISKDYYNSESTEKKRQRAWWSAFSLPLALLISLIPGVANTALSAYIMLLCLGIAQTFFTRWAWQQKKRLFMAVPVVITLITLAILALFIAEASSYLSSIAYVWGLTLFSSFISLLALPRNHFFIEQSNTGWDLLLNHPARILITTFFSLCAAGTLLLMLPVSTQVGIHFIDAAFTAVSAVCVTGLIVMDTPKDFTLAGQGIILLLIQLGGLGIMSLTTVALHTLGHRLSLRQERLLTSMTQTDHKDLVHALTTILKFTFFTELLGALSLSGLFYRLGDTLPMALWRGFFTSISAFCNAGFALQSDSLIPYQNHPLILHVISALIIFGGLAPAVALMLPRWFQRKALPASANVALLTTIVLLLSGTLMIAAFEWNGILEGLTPLDKIQNAWFQSVTLRTAGFNSVDLNFIAGPTFLVMVFFMFIGGSPGGTAGGVKTTSLGILSLTFWTHIRRREDVIVSHRRVPAAVIYQAVTIIMSGLIILFLSMMMLELTQQVSARELIFEAASAVGTAGLSIGATGKLDEMGKLIIIMTMFAGRIGPMTLFILLDNDATHAVKKYPDAKISLT